MEQFAEYGHAIVSMAVVAILGLLISPLTALRKTATGLPAGAAPKPDYDDPIYRMDRAYLNLTENMGLFLACALAAILAGASPYWVNWMASLFLLSRVVGGLVHLAGIKPMNFGPRTFIFVIGWGASVVLGLMAIVAVL